MVKNPSTSRKEDREDYMDPETRAAFEESFAKNRKLLEKLAKL